MACSLRIEYPDVFYNVINRGNAGYWEKSLRISWEPQSCKGTFFLINK